MNVDRGIWEIVNKNIYNSVEDLLAVLKSENIKDSGVDDTEKENEESKISWEDEQKVKIENDLLEKILMMNEYDFESFCALIFNKMGCSEVQTTPKSGDHGIDGYGKYKINEIMTSKFAFQCKKFARENKVSEPEMNAFIGACDTYKRGVFITTSSFTKGAIEKAKNSNCVIDLIDGDKLKSILFDLKIGYKTSYVLDDELFTNYKFEG